MTLKRIIEDYVKQLPKRMNTRDRKNTLDMLNNFFNRIKYLDKNVQFILNNFTGFFEKIPDGIKEYSRDKGKLVNCIRDFLQYFSVQYNIEFDVNTYLPPMIYFEKYERMIEILKYLHEGPKTREEIATNFNISIENLNDDLKELQNGDYSFLGYKMQIDLKRGENTYDSTIHPIFLRD